MLNDARDFTVLIKNTATYPKFNFKVSTHQYLEILVMGNSCNEGHDRDSNPRSDDPSIGNLVQLDC